jgi:PQQ-like domain
VSEMVIDLGELPQRGQSPAAAPATRPPFPYRAVLGGLAVILVALCAGAARREGPPTPTVIAARLDDTTFVAGDRLFVVGAGTDPSGPAPQNKTISAYALPAGTLLSRTTVAVSGAIFDVVAVADTILVSYQVDTVGTEATVAFAAGTDRALWRHPARLLAVSARDGLVLLRENSPQLGNLHWYGIDLATGATRWALDQPALGYTTEADYRDGFPARLVTAGVDGRVDVRDTASGTVLARATVPVPRDWSRGGISMWAVDDMVLLGGRAGTTAYALADLSRRWTTTLDLAEQYVLPHCDNGICVVGAFNGVQVIDSATGRQRWASDRWGILDPAGAYLLASNSQRPAGQQPLAVVDPLTGRQHGDFGAWRVTGDPRPDGTIIGLRRYPGQDVVWYAVLNPATLTMRLLGAAQRVTDDCRTTQDVLICRRLDASVGLWRLG